MGKVTIFVYVFVVFYFIDVSFSRVLDFSEVCTNANGLFLRRYRGNSN
jgi:hypothetical protein